MFQREPTKVDLKWDGDVEGEYEDMRAQLVEEKRRQTIKLVAQGCTKNNKVTIFKQTSSGIFPTPTSNTAHQPLGSATLTRGSEQDLCFSQSLKSKRLVGAASAFENDITSNINGRISSSGAERVTLIPHHTQQLRTIGQSVQQNHTNPGLSQGSVRN